MALRVLAYINLINAVLLFCAATLIFLPAPHYLLWLAGVAASELPLQIAMLALVLLAVSFILLRLKRHRKISVASASLALLASLLALADIGSIYHYASANRFDLSASDCFNFLGLDKNAQKLEAQEYAKRDGRPLNLDIYEPISRSTGKRAAIVVVHGGSWRNGRRSDFAQYDFWLAGLGYTVFDLDYRLCNSSVHFPAPVQDIEQALSWIKAHADQYHVDRDRIALLGRSAGAELALVAAYRTALAGSTLKPVRCVVSLYGPTDLTWNYHHPVKPDVIDTAVVLKNYIGGPPDALPELYAQASPINLICDQTPPSLFLHGGRDQLVSTSNVERLEPLLKTHRIPYEYCLLPWANHGFDWHCSGFSSQISKAVIKKFLQKYLTY